MPRAVNLADRFKVLARDNFRCVYCGVGPEKAVLHVDHKFPKSKGGENALVNYVTACFSCNIGKSDTLLEEILGRTAFGNDEWRCDGEGLEHVKSGYFIENERLNEVAHHVGDWCSEWLEHVSHKPFDLEPFIEAFRESFVISATPVRFDLRRSIQRARENRKESIAWDAEWKRPLANKYGAVPYLISADDFSLMDDFRSN